MKRLDLNADLGEGCGDDAAMLNLVTSANIACGGHAGDDETIARTAALARDNNVVIGAHPGFEDKANFGRRRMDLPLREVERLVAVQIDALMKQADAVGARVDYVKPHGALANWIAEDRTAADAVIAGLSPLDSPALLAMSGSELEHAGRAAGLDVYREIFADRAYLPSGRLAPRNLEGAVVHDPAQVSSRVARFLETGCMPTVSGEDLALDADSLCVHGDTPGAVAMARGIRSLLEAVGVTVAAFVNAPDDA